MLDKIIPCEKARILWVVDARMMSKHTLIHIWSKPFHLTCARSLTKLFIMQEAIPFFDEVFAPLFVSLANNQTNPLVDFLWSGSTESNDASIKSYPPTSVDLINISIELSRNAVRGKCLQQKYYLI